MSTDSVSRDCAAADMHEANERTRIMLDAMPMCCNFWDENYNNIDCNEEAARLFDLTGKQEYLDRFAELSPEYQPNGRLSSECALEHIRTAFATGYNRFEWLHQKLNGEPVPAEITLVRVPRGDTFIVAGYTRDLREFKAMLAEIREADERTRIMLDATPLCCNFWDENCNNIDCNEAAARLFGLKDKQEYLERFAELSPEYQPNGRLSSECALEHIRTAFTAGYDRFEWMHQKLNGEPVPAEITLVRVKRGDKFIVAGYTRDLRELKAFLAEIRKSEEELRRARDLAEQSTLAKSEFLANMSHEIRTPMNAILGMVHLLFQTGLTEKQRDYLAKTEQSATLLLRIINDILDFSKIEAGKLEMEQIPFSLGNVLQGISGLVDGHAAAKGLELVLEESAGLPPVLVGDPVRLQQILLNLINNAIKFTSRGQITLSVAAEEIVAGSAVLRFSVRDTGIGMTAEQVVGLFQPFTQADASTTRKYGGTGLGLAICRRLVQLMRGEIHCKSEPGVGTTFSFSAVFGIAAEALEPARAGRAPGDADVQGAPVVRSGADVRILLAEDNAINQMIALELLAVKGYCVDVAGTGIEALDLMRRNTYDLVLMDIQMPDMDGLAATTEIRKDPRFDTVPILAMTAHAMTGDRELSLAAGMDDHVTKPIDPLALYAAIDKWLVGGRKEWMNIENVHPPRQPR